MSSQLLPRATTLPLLLLPGDKNAPSVTHRARDVRAGGPLAVGPRRGRAADFLLLAQQLAVLLLPVLHVDEQRDEAVLHLGSRTWKVTTRQRIFSGGRTEKNWQLFHCDSVTEAN